MTDTIFGMESVHLPIRLPKGGGSKALQAEWLASLKDFADDLIAVQATLDFHMGSRDWCYALEPCGLDKGDFDWGEEQIKKARLRGFLRPGFILEEDGHKVSPAHDFEESPEEFVDQAYSDYQNAREIFAGSSSTYRWVSFWEDKDCYLQVLVEKAGLKSLFQDVCDMYRIPIANMRGSGSMEQKATMAANFQRMEQEGKRPVLLVCGDHDPPGLNISDVLLDHFRKYALFSGWEPENLQVDRIGLNYEFIEENDLTWIDGLGTGSGKDLADPNHYHYKRNIFDIQGYIEKYGARKCEANAIIVKPALGRGMLEDAIKRYVGEDALDLYQEKVAERREEIDDLIQEMLNEEGA